MKSTFFEVRSGAGGYLRKFTLLFDVQVGYMNDLETLAKQFGLSINYGMQKFFIRKIVVKKSKHGVFVHYKPEYHA
jgi:hypothetical protein